MGEFYDKHRELINSLVFLLVFIFLIGVLPLVALFAFRGAESSFNQRLVAIYYGLGTIFFLGIIGGKIAQHFAKKSDKVYDKIGWYGSIINNPEMGFVYNKEKGTFFGGLGWLKKVKNQLWFGAILFSIIGIFAVIQNTFLIDLPNLTQQILPIGEAILEVEPSGVEILGLVFLVGLNMYFWRWMQKKNKWSDGTYWFITILTNIVVGLAYGLPLHFFAYPDSDKAILGVMFFWFSATMLITLFGSLVLVWLFKDIHNLFQYLNDHFADERIILFTALALALVALIVLAVFLIKREKRKK